MVWLERYKSSVVKKILGLLNKADDDLIEKVAGRVAKIEQRGFDLGPATTKRLEALQKAVTEDRKAIYAILFNESKEEFANFAIYEADFQARLLETFAVELQRPSSSLLKAVATTQPFRGRLLRQWYSGLERGAATKINDAIKIGIVEGETTDQIVRRVRGTRSLRYSDGILEIGRREAQTITRTAIAHVSDRASQELWSENRDIIRGVKWVSTLDSRTSAICRERDGKIYKIDSAPPVPAHFNCRSRKIAYLGEFQVKGSRASRGGPVPEDTSYEQWLRDQPRAVQEEVLGVRKARLFREGGLPIDRFQDRTGREYTLDELRQRDREIWDRVF